jgi:uncharacterized protein (DUF3084 family)
MTDDPANRSTLWSNWTNVIITILTAICTALTSAGGVLWWVASIHQKTVDRLDGIDERFTAQKVWIGAVQKAQQDGDQERYARDKDADKRLDKLEQRFDDHFSAGDH